jgi:hypothetical protein
VSASWPIRIDHQVLADAAAGEGEHRLAVDSRLARTHSSQKMQRLKSSSTSGWEASTGRSGKKWRKRG